MSGTLRSRARLVHASLAFALAVSACGDDGPTGPSDDFDIVGAWAWRVTDATDGNVTCSIDGVTLTFARTNGTVTGHRVSPGGGNVTCTVGGTPTISSYTTNDELDDLSHVGTSISFTFATSAGTWEMSGSITGDDSMGGTATIRLINSLGSVVLQGPWTATRN